MHTDNAPVSSYGMTQAEVDQRHAQAVVDLKGRERYKAIVDVLAEVNDKLAVLNSPIKFYLNMGESAELTCVSIEGVSAVDVADVAGLVQRVIQETAGGHSGMNTEGDTMWYCEGFINLTRIATKVIEKVKGV